MTERTKPPLRVVVAGLGYFSQFHLAAWHRHPGAELTGLCDTSVTRLQAEAAPRGLIGERDLAAVLMQVPADIVDIVAPPSAHAALIRSALAPGRIIICQKPFCQSIAEARALIAEADRHGTQVVIHENFRFQPWHRTIKAFLKGSRMGQVYQARFALRPGDGRGPEAYLARQPAFQTMPRLLLHETGVHFIDLFRWFFGEISDVYAETRRLNPAIAGEDAGTMTLRHRSGVLSVFDGNRLSDHVADNLRHTMGEMVIEGEGGTLTLGGDGRVSFRPFGSTVAETVPLIAPVQEDSFGGGCVAALIDHVVQSAQAGVMPENTAAHYLHVMTVTEAAYRSADQGCRVTV